MQIELRSIDELKQSFKSTFEFEDGKLIQVQKAISDGDKDSRIERHIDGDDQLIIVSYPILDARISIFRFYLFKKPILSDVILDVPEWKC